MTNFSFDEYFLCMEYADCSQRKQVYMLQSYPVFEKWLIILNMDGYVGSIPTMQFLIKIPITKQSTSFSYH